MNKTYSLYGEKKSYAETKLFIENYYKSILHTSNNRYTTILKHIPPKVLVLDYGCGWGIFSKMLADKGCYVEGIDMDNNSIDIARDIIKENDFLKFRNLLISDIHDETYDYVVSNQVIEHTNNPGNYLMECNRVLKNDGILVISLPNVINLRFFAGQFANFNKKFTKYFTEYTYDKTHDHIQAWDPLTFMKLLNSMGFDYVAHEFMEGMALPMGKYLNLGVPYLKNLSYTMMFKVQKMNFVKIKNFD